MKNVTGLFVFQFVFFSFALSVIASPNIVSPEFITTRSLHLSEVVVYAGTAPMNYSMLYLPGQRRCRPGQTEWSLRNPG